MILTGEARPELVVEIRDLESGFDLALSLPSVELSGADGKIALADLMVDSSDINSAFLAAYPAEDLQSGE